MNDIKCVFVIDEALPTGLAVNAAAVLAVTIGQRFGHIVGPDVVDASDQAHTGLTQITLPVLKASNDTIRTIRQEAAQADVFLVDLTDCAQSARNYDDYQQAMALRGGDDLSYRGIALYGSQQTVKRLTKKLPLFS
ncbi:MAG TPA: DUF2000 domain-containing protein [Phototrophicaceae bacterium]|nr:DUF2000 domain-containing protein [Phototrophicaceae bacterium]